MLFNSVLVFEFGCNDHKLSSFNVKYFLHESHSQKPYFFKNALARRRLSANHELTCHEKSKLLTRGDLFKMKKRPGNHLERAFQLLSNSVLIFEFRCNYRELLSFEVGPLCRRVILKNYFIQNALAFKGLKN